MTKLKPSEIYVRDAQESDLAFIFSSWLKSYRGGFQSHMIENTIYYTEQHKLIERLLQRCTVQIACNPATPEDIFGYVVHERIDGIFVLHCAYIKHPFRRLGIFLTLLEKAGFDRTSAGLFTHATRATYATGHRLGMVYHPYILTNYLHKKEGDNV